MMKRIYDDAIFHMTVFSNLWCTRNKYSGSHPSEVGTLHLYLFPLNVVMPPADVFPRYLLRTSAIYREMALTFPNKMGERLTLVGTQVEVGAFDGLVAKLL